ncbi:glycoside hydrolase family 30 protein [Laccaria bicolor S238N-H82]|uniref:Glycoside hydrolase family 30 protein n=1 Tax=Laccaria bicolor (strain S238N-H82 / ATCC MYA-4686) TaxID=486041 RepID=B0D052_LACBS|nr:glycoside hydrolase family 30 protein [Laccaria bicolor S238N-H82]EDR11767.1 glycoside hydrolase family 30 protein [Laccaria bicolor S238N-H82]|eukprot:XP_001877664.1 glycoside hydrolase family 30 protein [Laccaria bicolor S238N-H82]
MVPGWMKDSGSMNGGSLQSKYVPACKNSSSTTAFYLLSALQVLRTFSKPYKVSQNEPQNNNPTYPTCTMSPAVEALIGAALRTLLNINGLSTVRVIWLRDLQHNWDDAGEYPVALMEGTGNSFAGVAFHCYAGAVSNQDSFHNSFPAKEIYFSECAGTIGSDWWSDIKVPLLVSLAVVSEHVLSSGTWIMFGLGVSNITRNPSVPHLLRSKRWASNVEQGLRWNIAADANGNPKLPGTNSCGGAGCHPLVTVNGDGSYTLDQECDIVSFLYIPDKI